MMNLTHCQYWAQVEIRSLFLFRMLIFPCRYLIFINIIITYYSVFSCILSLHSFPQLYLLACFNVKTMFSSLNFIRLLWVVFLSSQRDCRLIFSGSHPRYACMEFKHFDNLYHKQQNCPRLWNWNAIELRMKNQCGKSVGVSFRAALWFRQGFCLCEVSETNVVIQSSSYFHHQV